MFFFHLETQGTQGRGFAMIDKMDQKSIHAAYRALIARKIGSEQCVVWRGSVPYALEPVHE